MPTVTYSRQTIRSQFQANSWTNSNQLAPDVLGLSNGGYVVAYNNSDINAGFILLNFYDATGAALGFYKIPYTGSSTDAVGAPSLTQLDNGNVLVVWDDADASFDGMRGTIFSPTGAVIVHNMEISGVASDIVPQVTALAGGGFVTTYQSSANNIWARIHDSAGNPVGGEFSVAASGAAESDPAITALADGGFVVTWTNDNAGTIEIWARIFNANGSARTDGFVAGAFGTNTQPSVAALPNGNWAVAYRDSGWGDEDTGITLTIMSPTGAVVNLFEHVNTPGDPANESDPDIAVLENGFIVVTWTYPFSPGVDEDIYARVFDQSGNPVTLGASSAQFVIDASTSNDLFSSISAIVSGQFIVGWQDSNTGDGSDGRISATVQEIVRTTTGDGTSENLVGDALRDVIIGGGGNDVMIGGGANDVYEVTEAGDVVFELANEGTDDVFAYANFTLADNVENLFMNYGSQTYGYGNGLGNTIIGNAQANVIEGRGGGDIIDGGGGNDHLDGGTGNDTMTGGDGADVLLGGTGTDVMIGGVGSDIYEVDNIGDSVVELAGEGTADNVFAYVNYTLPTHTENLLMNYGLQTHGYGNSGDNIIVGNGQANVIEGRGGYDTITGGAGSDLFIVNPNFGVDVITDFVAGAGTQDAVLFSQTLFSNFAQVMANSAQVGADTWIGDGFGNTVVLVGVQRTSLHADDFGFF